MSTSSFLDEAAGVASELIAYFGTQYTYTHYTITRDSRGDIASKTAVPYTINAQLYRDKQWYPDPVKGPLLRMVDKMNVDPNFKRVSDSVIVQVQPEKGDTCTDDDGATLTLEHREMTSVNGVTVAWQLFFERD